MDWTLTGVLGGVAILAGVVGYGSFALIHSDADAGKQTAAQVALIPARERPLSAQPTVAPIPTSTVSNSTMLTPPTQTIGAAPKTLAVAGVGSAVPAQGSQSTVPEPVGDRWNGYPKSAGYAADGAVPRIQGYPDARFQARQGVQDNGPILYEQDTPMERRPAGPTAGYSPVIAHADTASIREPHIPAPYAPRPQSEYEWKVVTTAKANYFNLGGHVDQNGIVDSLASSYLRNALQKQKNYAKLPPGIRAYIDAPRINLAKIAGYRSLLGVDDRKMELEQGVRFIRVASSRGFELATRGVDIGAADAVYGDASLDMNALNKMDFDITSAAILGFIP